MNSSVNGMDADLVSALRAALGTSLRARDKCTTAALRAALAAIANAEAIPVATGSESQQVSEHIAGAAIGLGSTEATRRPVEDAEARLIVEAEIAERRVSAHTFQGRGRDQEAAALARGADALRTVLDSNAASS